MAKEIVISINPKYVEKIINGSKKFEYRTKAAKQDVKKIIIYETIPTKKIVAEAEIIEVLMMEPEKLWEKTKEFSGVSKEFFDQYFKERKVAYAYRLGKVKVYDEPKELNEFGLKVAPQSFVYLNY
ncbi:MAG: ASCH domain-containing protein [Bacilli bacterium]|nr:ASCH domain-containing protein [Bacilli bacterium]